MNNQTVSQIRLELAEDILKRIEDMARDQNWRRVTYDLDELAMAREVIRNATKLLADIAEYAEEGRKP